MIPISIDVTDGHIEKLVRKYWRTRLDTYNCTAEDKITVDEWLAELEKRKQVENEECGGKENACHYWIKSMPAPLY